MAGILFTMTVKVGENLRSIIGLHFKKLVNK